MNILIIGYKGYIGSRLINFLQDNFNTIAGCDIRDGEDFEHLSKEDLSLFQVVILLAANSSVRDCLNNFNALNNNITNVIELIKKLNPTQKFIYMSSSSVYGNCHDEPADENTPLDTPHNEYDFSKRIIDEYIVNTNTQYYGLRLGTVNGWSPNMRNELVINAMVKSAISNNVVCVYNPSVYRAILSITDLCRAIYTIITCNEDKRGIYNLASFNNNMENMGKEIANEMNVECKIFGEDEENFKTSYSFSMLSSKFETAFNFKFENTLSSIVKELRNESKVTERITCRVCDKPVYKLLDLGSQPLANDYHNNSTELDVYPLCLMLCSNCYHTQLSHVVRPDILYRYYQYVSGTSKTLNEYFKWLANEIDNKAVRAEKTILEIACNDGSQLDIFKQLGWNTYGVDPASNIVKNITQHTVYNDFFNLHFAQKFRENHPDVELNCIMGQNVIAHLDDVHNFIQACKYLMNDDTLLYLQTSQCNMYKNNEFDTIYHEHHSFFSINSMITLVEKNGLYMKHVEKTDIHGTSFLFTISKSLPTTNEQSYVYDCLVDENLNKLHNVEFYQQYANNVISLCNNIKNTLIEYKNNGYKIIGYGAAAKGNTLLNYIQFTLDYIVDDCDIKWNLFTPGMNIPIYSPDKLKQEDGKILIVPLAWNFFNEIYSKVNTLIDTNQIDDLAYIKYFPQVEIIKKPKPVATVICHFYNEEYLLPFWLNHHKEIFSHGIMINYNSTDKSVDIIRSIVPDWEIIDSRNRDFDSKLCDEEVMDIEKKIKGWKIALNVTEFLSCNLNELLNSVDNSIQSITITCYPMVESYENESQVEVSYEKSLLHQRTYGIKNNSRSTRTIHRAPCGNYCQGRHYNRVSPAHISNPSEAIILWYGYSPFNNSVIKRKLQIQTRMSLSDKINNMGKEHLVTKSTLINNYVSQQNYLVDFSTDEELKNHFKKIV